MKSGFNQATTNAFALFARHIVHISYQSADSGATFDREQTNSEMIVFCKFCPEERVDEDGRWGNSRHTQLRVIRTRKNSAFRMSH